MKFLVVLAFCAVAASAVPTKFGGLKPTVRDDEYEPIHVGPAIVDEEHDNELESIDVGPAIIDGGVIEGPSSSPLVQIIVNVSPNSGIAGSPVIVEGLPQPDPVIIDEPEPSPIIVVDEPEPEPESVIIVEPEEAEVVPPVVGLPEAEVAPPVISLPGILN